MRNQDFLQPAVFLKVKLFLVDGGFVEASPISNVVFELFDVALFALPMSSLNGQKSPFIASMWAIYLCACLLSSCRRVRAGLLSGFGPLLFCGCPSITVASMTNVRADANKSEYLES